jgi:hypothetical protein
MQHLKLGNIAPAIAAAIDQKTYRLMRVTFGLISIRRMPAWLVIAELTRQIRSRTPICRKWQTALWPQPDRTAVQLHKMSYQPANHRAPDFHDTHSTKAIVKQGCALCHGAHLHLHGLSLRIGHAQLRTVKPENIDDNDFDI